MFMLETQNCFFYNLIFFLCSANAGFYKTSCTTENYCPTDQFTSAKWQKFTYELPVPYTASLNRCANIKCIDGYFMNRYEYAGIMGNSLTPGCRSGPMTGSLAYDLESWSACKAKLEAVCQLSKTCGPGYTYLRTKQGDFVLSTNPWDDGDKICVECPVCPRGTYLATPCTMTSYPVCVKCPWNGWYNMYEHQGQCIMDYDLPPGFFPYQAWITNSYKQSLTQYDIFPTKMLQQDGTLVDINDSILFLNYLVSCSVLPEGYEFKEWSTRPSVKVKILNPGESFPTEENCNLLNSARCKAYSSTLKKGWFLNSSNVCQLCKSSSTQQTCGWFEYGKLETCNGVQDTQCAPCRGNIGQEAVFTNSYFPFYFDDSQSSPCNYDCNTGFYKNDAGTCTLCTNKPDNSIYAKGPLRIDDTELDGKYCISTTDCKYFGGTKLKGCDWECLPNFRKIEKYGITPREYMCEACPVVTCLPGFKLERPSFSPCLACVSCNDAISNAIYSGGGCNQICNSGFYRKNNTFCEKCTLKTCSSNEYNYGCFDALDFSCKACSVCPIGSTVKRQCNLTHNTQCEGCTAVLVANSEYDSSCNVVCSSGFVMSNGQCIRCATNDNDCPGGKYYTPSCTESNRGCLNCTSPDTYNYCWVSGLQACQWSCARFFRKTSNVCVPDNSITTYPLCLTAIVWPPPTTTITAIQTTSKLLTSASTLQTTTNRLSTSLLAIQTTSKLSTSVSPIQTTSKFSSTSIKYTSSTPKFATSTTKVVTNITELSTTSQQLDTFRYVYEVSNLPLQQCLCKSKQFVTGLSESFKTAVYILSCTDSKEDIICVNFTCPCNITSRRLLQITTNVTVVQVVAEKEIILNESTMNMIVQSTFSPQTTVVASSVQKLDMKGIYWNTNELFKQFIKNIASGDDTTMFIIIGVVGGVVLVSIVVALILIFYVFKKEIFGDDTATKQIKTNQRLTLYVKLNQKVN